MKKKLLGTLAVAAVVSGAVGLANSNPVQAAENPEVVTEEAAIHPFLWAGAVGTVNSNNVNFRTGAGPGFASLGQVHAGTNVQWLNFQRGTDGHWWEYVRITTGANANRTGWIRTDFIGNWR